ncbi:hypothetical protein YPPY54_0727, partial [Yersinia pestis PY-54]
FMRLIGKSLENLTILSIFFWHKKPKNNRNSAFNTD